MSIFRALRHPKFALLLSGQTLSRVGDFVFQLALAWWVLEKTGSAFAMGTVMVFSMLPTVIFILLGGVIVDRFHRARLLFHSDVGRGIIMAIITWLAVLNRLEIWMIYALTLAFSFADAFFQPAFFAIVPELVPADDLPSANSLSSLSVQFGRIVGPAVGGWLVASGGTAFAFGINAASFFISGLLLLPMLSAGSSISQTDQTALHPLAILDDVKQGWSVVAAHPILWLSIATFSLTNILLVGPFTIAFPFLVKDFMQSDERMLGFLLSIFPIGFAISSLMLGSLKRLRWRGPVLYLGAAAAGACLALFGLPVPVWALVIAALINGAALDAGSLSWTSILQEVVPAEKLGRVSSIDTLGSIVLTPLGFALTALAVDRLGPAATFLLGGGLTALIMLPLAFWKPIRQFD